MRSVQYSDYNKKLTGLLFNQDSDNFFQTKAGYARNPIMFFPRQCGELGSQKAAAILGRLWVCRTRMELSPMLRAAHPHPAQACLAFANPPPAETKFATRRHRASLRASPE